MLTIALAFCAGSAAIHMLPSLLPAAVLPAAAIAAALVARRWPAGASFLAGFAWTHLLAAQLLASGWPCERDREELRLTGRVASPAIERDRRVDFDLDVLRPAVPDAPGRARVAWYDPEGVPAPGESWQLTVRLRCRHGFANPGAPDRELDLLRQRIDATGYVAGKTRPERLASASERPIEHLRARIAGAIAAAVPDGPSVAVLQGLSVGVRGNIPDALWEAFAVTGVAHLMAISGLHVTGCALFVLLLLRLAWRLPGLARLRGRLALETSLVVAATAGYTLLSGASLPALRTLAMVVVVACLRLMRRMLPVHALLALAGMLLVAADPLALLSAGFWLSMIATAALLAVLYGGEGWAGRLAAFARSQAAVTALLTPVLAATFGRISLVSPLANAIAIPLFSFMLLPAVLCATVLEIAAPGTAGGIWRALAALLDAAWPRLEAMAAWPASSTAPAAPGLLLVAGTGLAVLAAVWLPLRAFRLAALAMLATVAFGDAGRPAAGAWTLTVLDVGQGLAAVVETARHVMVFDTGPRWQGGGAAARVSLVPFLRARGIRRIDLLLLSHDDADHAGGADLLRRTFDVARTMAAPGSDHAADAECLRGSDWRWDGIAFRVLHPPAGFEGGANDRSCALAIEGAGGSALLLADPEASAESALVAGPLAADVVLLPHHGSRSSSSTSLVAAVGARLGIASAGFGNRWGMPAEEVLARWRAAGTTVLGTAEHGAVTVHFPARAHAAEISTERDRARHWWRRAAAER